MESRARQIAADLAAYITTWQHALMLASLLAIGILATIMVKRAMKDATAKLSKAGVFLTVFIVVGTTIDGALKFADLLGATGPERLFPAAVFESVFLAIYQRARDYAKFHDGPGHWGIRLYMIGIIDGCIISMAASNVPMAIFRFSMPIIAVWLLNMELEPLERPAGVKTRWRYTPTQIGIKLGILRAIAGDTDAADDDREALIRRMVRHGASSESFFTGWWHKRRLRKAYMAGGHHVDYLHDAVGRAANLSALDNLFSRDPAISATAVRALSATPATNGHRAATATGHPATPATNGHRAATATGHPATPATNGHRAATATEHPATPATNGHRAATATEHPATPATNGHRAATATEHPATPATNGHRAATATEPIRVPAIAGRPATAMTELDRRIPNPVALDLLRSGRATSARQLITEIPGLADRTARRWVNIYNGIG